MKKPMRKKARVALGILIAVLLIGLCFFCVSLYAKKEFNKPRFEIPDPPEKIQLQLTTKEEAAAFAERLYAEAAGADDVEGSWRTNVSLDGEWQTPFSDADNRLLQYFGSRAQNEIGTFYPSVSGVLMTQAQDAPSPLTGAAVSAFAVQQEDGKDRREDPYTIILTRDPAAIDTDRMAQSEILDKIAEKLSSVAQVEQIEAAALEAQERYRVDHASDQLLWAEFTHTFRIHARVRLTMPGVDDAAQEAEIDLPYRTVQRIDFKHYGVRFTAGGIVSRYADKLGMSVETNVGQADDYTLSFTSDAPDVLEFDDDYVMTVLKRCDDPITVTATLTYAGHTYTDTATVYITDLEVASDE